MFNYYMGCRRKPFHLSVGGILLNDKNQVLMAKIKGTLHDTEAELQILMRETMLPGESLEESVLRGLMEEFHAKAEVLTYIGQIISDYHKGESKIAKCTVYFLCKFTGFSEGEADIETKNAKFVWVDLPEAIKVSEAQGKITGRTDMDESSVLRAADEYLRCFPQGVWNPELYIIDFDGVKDLQLLKANVLAGYEKGEIYTIYSRTVPTKELKMKLAELEISEKFNYVMGKEGAERIPDALFHKLAEAETGIVPKDCVG